MAAAARPRAPARVSSAFAPGPLVGLEAASAGRGPRRKQKRGGYGSGGSGPRRGPRGAAELRQARAEGGGGCGGGGGSGSGSVGRAGARRSAGGGGGGGAEAWRAGPRARGGV